MSIVVYSVPIYNEQRVLTNWKWLCFKHAVQRARKGEDVELEIKDYDGPPAPCADCK